MIVKFKFNFIFKKSNSKISTKFAQSFFSNKNKLEDLKNEMNKFQKDEKPQEKIENFYSFMEDNMNKYENKNQCKMTSNSEKQEKINTNNKSSSLIDFIKCPMTDSNLEITEEGLKVGHIIYPKRNGIYILVEEEAQFKF
jgi:hypothetical protein